MQFCVIFLFPSWFQKTKKRKKEKFEGSSCHLFFTLLFFRFSLPTSTQKSRPSWGAHRGAPTHRGSPSRVIIGGSPSRVDPIGGSPSREKKKISFWCEPVNLVFHVFSYVQIDILIFDMLISLMFQVYSYLTKCYVFSCGCVVL